MEDELHGRQKVIEHRWLPKIRSSEVKFKTRNVKNQETKQEFLNVLKLFIDLNCALEQSSHPEVDEDTGVVFLLKTW